MSYAIGYLIVFIACPLFIDCSDLAPSEEIELTTIRLETTTPIAPNSTNGTTEDRSRIFSSILKALNNPSYASNPRKPYENSGKQFANQGFGTTRNPGIVTAYTIRMNNGQTAKIPSPIGIIFGLFGGSSSQGSNSQVNQGGYPSQGQSSGGYPSQGGYPPQGQNGQGSQGGYPESQGQGGYPSQGSGQNPQGRPQQGGVTIPYRPPAQTQKPIPTAKPSNAVPWTKLFPETCGIAQHTRIVGGIETDPKKWQWMAALMKNGGQRFCGGSLITDRHVLTAAHCLPKVTPRDIKVRIGDYSPSADPTTIDHKIAAFKIHPGYNDRTNQNDIAILVLDQKVTMTDDGLRPVCLPMEGRDYKDAMGTVIGYGATAYGSPGSSKLREVTLPVWDLAKCQKAYGNKQISYTQMCAGYDEGGKDSCQGDSGGPFMIMGPDKRWMLAGVVSWGHKCGEPGYPGVYTRVTEFNNLIYGNIND